jgi:hypothetical protein
MKSLTNEFFGADPIHAKWRVVRGDTAKLRVYFLEHDEVTEYDTTGWTFMSTAYNAKGEVLDSLEISVENGYVDVLATPEITSTWGTGHNSVSAELSFDVQVVTDEGDVWTPIIGTIIVLSDVTPVGGP